MDIISYNKAASVQKDLDNRVLTDVPENAVFTDTVITNVSELTNDAGYLTSFTETDPVFTAWDKSTGISITESQISDLGTYEPADPSILKGADIGVTVQPYNVNTVTTVSGKTGDVVLTKTDVSLDQVDNTSDLDKPISTATQSALDTKASQTFTITMSLILNN